MHIVMVMNSPSESEGRQYGVLGFVFEEDDTAADIPMLTQINTYVGATNETRLLTVKNLRGLNTDVNGTEFEMEF